MNLAQLKANCVLKRLLAEAYPDDKQYERNYELAQRKVQACERELFCDIKEVK